MRLYEIDAALEEALNRISVDEETGEVTANPDLEAIAALQMERDKKLENVALFIKNAESDAAAIAAEVKALNDRKRVLENRATSAREWLKTALGGEKFATARTAITYRTNRDTTIIDDATQIPDEFFPIKKTDKTASKTLIKQAIKDGETVPGAHLEDTISMILK